MEKMNFEELLKRYIVESGVSVRKIAAEVGIDRTLIQKYMSGSRLPKSWKEAERIAAALMLSPRQTDRLAEAFYKREYGERTYKSFLKIKDLLQGNGDLHLDGLQLAVQEEVMEQDKDCGGDIFYGKLKVEEAVSRLIIRECAEADGQEVKIRLLLQPVQETFIKAVCMACGSCPVKLEHIFCLDRSRHDNDNISIVFFSFAFEFSGINYQSRYYYEDVGSHINEMSLLPNMLLTDHHVLLCNSRMDEGIVIRRREQVLFFKRQWERLLQRTARLSTENRNIMDVTGLVDYINDSLKNKICISWFPCITLVIDDKLYQEHLLLPEKEKAQLIETMMKFRSRFMQKESVCNYFTESGLRCFMDTGCFPEYPQSIYRIPGRETRIALLERMISVAEQGLVEWHLSSEDKIAMKNYIAIYADCEGKVGFMKLDGSFGRLVMIDEPSINEVVHDFVGFAQEDGWFMDRQESLRKMKEILVEYRGCKSAS